MKTSFGALRAVMMGIVAASLLGGCIPDPGLIGSLSTLTGVASIAMPAGGLVDPASTDAATESVRVPSTDVQGLSRRLSAIAPKLGYRVDAVDDTGVRIVRQSHNVGTALIGRDWTEIIAVNVVDGGNALQILAKTQGNGGHAAPGTAQKIIDELKPHLAAAYAAR